MVDLKPAEKMILPPEDLERVEALCMCPSCPAYPEEDRGRKKAYCLRGDSDHKAKIEPSDCFCESCEIYKHGKLYGQNFYCLEGPALSKGLRNLLQGEPITKLARERQERVPALFVAAGFDVHRAHEKE